VYHLVLASRHVATGLDILADAIQNSAFDEEELRRELLVVLEEWKRGEDSPGAKAYMNLLKTAFPRHPYGRPVIGSREAILSINRQKVLDFFHCWYRPNNMTLVVVGDVDVNETKRGIERLFQRFAPSALPERIQGENGHQEEVRVVAEQAEFLESYLNFAFPIPSVHHEDSYALQVLSFILGGGESSRLYRIIKAEQQLVNSTFAHAFIAERGGLFIVGTSLEDRNLTVSLGQMIGEVYRLKHQLVDPQELKKARDNLESDFLYRKETSEGQAQQYGYFESVFHDMDYEEIYLSHLGRVKREDLQRVAQKYFNPLGLSVSFLVPKGASHVPSKDEVEKIVRLADGSPQARQNKTESRARMGSVTAVTLENGLRILIQENHNAPVVSFRAVALGGLLFENENNNGITNFVAGMITRGTRNYDYARLAQEIEGLAGGVDGSSGRNSLGLTGTFLSKNAVQGLELFLEAFVRSTFPEDEIEKLRQEILLELKNRDDDPTQLAFELFHRSLFISHPYRFSVLGMPETISRLRKEDLVDYYNRVFSTNRVVFSVVGDIDTKRVLSQLKEVLASLPNRENGLCLPPIEPPSREVRRREEVREKKQAHIVIGFQSCNLGSPDSFPLRVLQAVLSRQGGRLFMEIREKRGLAYSVTAFLAEGVAPGTFGVYAATDIKRVEESVHSVLRELERVACEEVPQNELERAKKYLIGSYEIGRQTVSDQNAEICFNELYGLGFDFGNRYVREIHAVEACDVLQVARKYIQLDGYTLTILRPGVCQTG
jgi:zinc protease